MRKRWCAAPAFMLVLAMLCGCVKESGMPDSASPPAGQEPVRITISGAAAMAPLVTDLGRQFESLYPGMHVDVQATQTRQAISNVRNGTSTIGMAMRNLGEDERDLQSFPIARDSAGIVVNKDNPVGALSAEQVVAIYTGRLTNWKMLAGADAALAPVTYGDGNAALELLTDHFGIDAAALHISLPPDADPMRVIAAASDPQLLTHMSLVKAERLIDNGVPIKLLRIDDTGASARNVRNGNYPVVRPLVFVTKDLPEGAAKQFIDFCLSSQATELVKQYDFIPYLD